MRAMATSFIFHPNHALDAIVRTAQWCCRMCFAAHYLRDVQVTYNTCISLGPFVAAGTVIA